MANNKYGASKDEVDPEPALELYCEERGDAEVLEADVVNFIDSYDNYEC